MPDTSSSIDYAAIFAVSPSPYCVLDRDLVIRDVNEAFLRGNNRTREELLGRRMCEAFPPNLESASDDGLAAMEGSLRKVLRTGEPDSMGIQQYDMADADGSGNGYAERYWAPVNTPVVGPDGEVQAILHRVVDVTGLVVDGGRYRQDDSDPQTLYQELLARAAELQVLNEELRLARDQLSARALHDPLTNLLIRPVFLEELSHALARWQRSPHPLAVLFVDVDRLKQVNDTHGHAAGDQMIRCVAERLSSAVRPGDPVARIGGDEFVVLLDNLDREEDAAVVAQRVLNHIGAPCQLAAGLWTQPTASVGVAMAAPRVSPTTLIAHADAAMYRAKQSGRGRYELFDPAAYLEVSLRRQLEADLAAALEAEQLRLHYQPIIDLTDGSVFAAEALLRWEHPVRGLLSAGDFIGVAEDSRLIIGIGRQVVMMACTQLAAWDAELGPRSPKQLFVNLSFAELAHPLLGKHVSEAAAAAGIEPGRLVLEITESGMLTEPGVAMSSIEELQALGCELAIDDFGTGYSTLSRLVQLPAETVKIDQSFVHAVKDGPEAAAVVSAVLLLGHNMRKTVIAEGVEDESTLTALQELGCSYAQGNYLGEPRSAADLSRYLAEHL